MSIKNIEALTNNPHFYSLLLQAFLSGYDQSCEIPLILTVIPILMFAETRNKLRKANKNSNIESIFHDDNVTENVKLSRKANFAGFADRYKLLEENIKDSIIILSSENKVNINSNKIELLKKIDYKNYSGEVKEWIRCSFYLGIIFSKSSLEHIIFLLGGI